MLAAVSLLIATSGDIHVSRDIDTLTIGTGVLTLDGDACADKDQYGSNNCDLKW